MRKKCDECGAYNGTHWSGCMSRGYLTVGPHPDAPQPATERAPVDPTPCPCGIARLDCDYHRPAPAPAPFEYGAFDLKAFTAAYMSAWVQLELERRIEAIALEALGEVGQ